MTGCLIQSGSWGQVQVEAFTLRKPSRLEAPGSRALVFHNYCYWVSSMILWNIHYSRFMFQIELIECLQSRFSPVSFFLVKFLDIKNWYHHLIWHRENVALFPNWVWKWSIIAVARSNAPYNRILVLIKRTRCRLSKLIHNFSNFFGKLNTN